MPQQELITDVYLISRMGLAVLLGGIIGIERERLNKTAGLRTMILICLGATLFTITSRVLGHQGDWSRIASNIVVGVGFIGGGVIFKNENKINGLTTAASIWVTAAIGVLIATFSWEVPVIVTTVMFFVLYGLKFLENIIESKNYTRFYQITYKLNLYQNGYIANAINQHKLNVNNEHFSRKEDTVLQKVELRGSKQNHQSFVQQMMQDHEIQCFEC